MSAVPKQPAASAQFVMRTKAWRSGDVPHGVVAEGKGVAFEATAGDRPVSKGWVSGLRPEMPQARLVVISVRQGQTIVDRGRCDCRLAHWHADLSESLHHSARGVQPWNGCKAAAGFQFSTTGRHLAAMRVTAAPAWVTYAKSVAER